MQQKVFIGIALEPQIQKKLTQSIAQWQDLPVKWYKEHNIFVTLFSFGWIGEEDVVDISNSLSEVCAHVQNFTVQFDHITAMAKDPQTTDVREAQHIRMTGHDSTALRDLYQKIADKLDLPVGTKQTFKPYVDLGRIRKNQWQKLPEYPDMPIDFTCIMDVYAVTLFENTQVDGKRQFVPIDVYELQ